MAPDAHGGPPSELYHERPEGLEGRKVICGGLAIGEADRRFEEALLGEAAVTCGNASR